MKRIRPGLYRANGWTVEQRNPREFGYPGTVAWYLTAPDEICPCGVFPTKRAAIDAMYITRAAKVLER